MKRKFILLITVLVAILTSSCNKLGTTPPENTRVVPYESEDFAMGTVVMQRIYDDNGKKISKQVIDRIRKIEEGMTINKLGGQINKLNEFAGIDFVELDKDDIYILEKAKEYSEISNGAFDVTVGPLVKKWGVFSDNPSIPSMDEIHSLLGIVGFKDIKIDKPSSRAKLDKKGQVVDLGGIAKGFAGDEAIKIYKKHGVKSAFISIGGNIVLLGGKPDSTSWKVGVRDPRGPEGSYIAVINAKDKAIVSSGDYQRYFEKEGVRYHHIIDPRTGYPADSGLIGTTVVSELSIDADALSTAAFVLGLESGMDLIEKIEGVEAVFITDKKKVYITEGLSDQIQFEDENEYEYIEKR